MRLISFVMALLLSVQLLCSQPVPDSVAAEQSVGLVLSGGGAKGVAHIGVIQALEDNDIPIDYISGTSMGAIVGSLYAMGYTPEQMMELLGSREFANWSTGRIDKKLSYYFLQDAPSPAMLTLNFGEGKAGRKNSILPSSLINPLPMNFGFMELYSAATAQCGGDFNRLFVPFRAVVSDVSAHRGLVCKSGSLGDAVRASMSFPLVFHPTEIDGRMMYDGGIYDNFPVDVMTSQFAPSIMIGVDVSSDGTDTGKSDVVSQLENLIMQPANDSIQPWRGIKMRIHLEQFALLDFDKARQIYKIGYDKAMSMMDSIKSRIHTRIPAEARTLRRKVYRSATPYLRFDSVNVTGGTPSQNSYVRYLFTHNRPDTFGLARARAAYYRAITPGKFRNLVPQAIYNDSTGLFTLDLRATLKNNFDAGIGGYLSTSTNSMLFLTTGYKTLSFNSFDARFNAWIGQSYLGAEASAHIRLLRAVPSGLELKAVASRQKYFPRDSYFFQTSDPTVLTSDEFYGRLAYGVAAGRNARVEVAAGYGLLIDKYYHNVMPEAGTIAMRYDDRLTRRLAKAEAMYEYSTLNSVTVPTDGAFYRLKVLGVLGRRYFSGGGAHTVDHRSHHAGWGQIELLCRKYWNLSPKFSLGAELNILASSHGRPEQYSEAVAFAPAYIPSPSFNNVLSPSFRAYRYAAAAVVPVWKLNNVFQLRSTFDLFLPESRIKEMPDGTAWYGRRFSTVEYFAQAELVMALPFTNVSAYCHYSSVPEGRWNFGLTFGLFLQAPRFLR